MSNISQRSNAGQTGRRTPDWFVIPTETRGLAAFESGFLSSMYRRVSEHQYPSEEAISRIMSMRQISVHQADVLMNDYTHHTGLLTWLLARIDAIKQSYRDMAGRPASVQLNIECDDETVSLAYALDGKFHKSAYGLTAEDQDEYSLTDEEHL